VKAVTLETTICDARELTAGLAPYLKGKKMAYETKELSGSVFTNTRKERDTHPDYTGEAKIEGKLYWVNCWQKTDKNGKPWFSFALKPKDFTPAKEAIKSAPKPNDFDDEIPF
jgi:hypothetical protein